MRIASILVVATCMACSASTTADGSSPSRRDASASDGEVPIDPDDGANPEVDGGSVGDGGSPTVDGAAVDSGPKAGCYREVFDGSVSLADLKSAYAPSKWLSTALTALQRRYPDGHGILDATKSDPQLADFADGTSWAGLMMSIDTMCHEETHGWDFDTSLKKPGKHVFWLRKDLALEAPTAMGFFARKEILPMVGDAGTSMYDETYLVGDSGEDDFVFLADELNAYINGLACATAVGGEITANVSYRDGAAAHLYYLELYLKKARTTYPTTYAKMKADAEWMKFVRYAWARGHFWTEASKPFAKLGIEDAKIRAKVNLADNLAEIRLFTGDEPDDVACTP